MLGQVTQVKVGRRVVPHATSLKEAEEKLRQHQRVMYVHPVHGVLEVTKENIDSVRRID